MPIQWEIHAFVQRTEGSCSAVVTMARNGDAFVQQPGRIAGIRPIGCQGWWNEHHVRRRPLFAGGHMSFHSTRGASRAVALACGLSVAAATSTVLAQTPPAPDQTLEEVVVTGSRIARPNLESPVPVTTVTADELFETGSTSVGDLLNDLPALRSTFSQSNSTPLSRHHRPQPARSARTRHAAHAGAGQRPASRGLRHSRQRGVAGREYVSE